MKTPAPASRPLVMTPGNVRLLIARRKWQTRRIIDPPLALHDFGCGDGPVLAFTGKHCRPGILAYGLSVLSKPENSGGVVCPYGKVGDTLWIQENYRVNRWEYKGPGANVRVLGEYCADGAPFDVVLDIRESALFDARERKTGTSPGRFMYRSLSRLERTLAEIRADRLQAITRADAIAEGMSDDRPLACLFDICGQFPKLNIGALAADDPTLFTFGDDRTVPTDYEKVVRTTARGAYAALWEGIHGPGSWGKNPPVWILDLA